MNGVRWREAPATVAIAVATLVASTLILVTGSLPAASVSGGVIPLRFEGAALTGAIPAWLTPLSATLIHGGAAHLALNLVMLGFCGALAERALGMIGTAALYLAGAYAAALAQWALAPASPVPMIGASGAISALVAAYALLYGRPRTRDLGPFSARVLHVAWLAAAWIGIQALIGFAGMGVPGAGGTAGIAVGAHVGGFLTGLLLARPLLLWRYRDA